jgi:hypothetical protein
MSSDPVNSPAHYTQSRIECIDAIEASMSPMEFSGFLKGQVMKYIWRYRHKGRAQEDLEKGGWYSAPTHASHRWCWRVQQTTKKTSNE